MSRPLRRFLAGLALATTETEGRNGAGWTLLPTAGGFGALRRPMGVNGCDCPVIHVAHYLTPNGPTLQTWHIGAALLRMRDAAGLTLNQRRAWLIACAADGFLWESLPDAMQGARWTRRLAVMRRALLVACQVQP